MNASKPWFIYLKAKKKSGQKDLVFWESKKSENRVLRDAENELEDAGLKNEDFFSPVTTDFPVVDDVPEEGVLDGSWCDYWQLADDKVTWQKIPGAERVSTRADAADHDTSTLTGSPADNAKFEHVVLGACIYTRFDTLTPEQEQAISALHHDTDATYPQNLLLAAAHFRVRQLKVAFSSTVFDLVESVKSVWPVTGKAPDLSKLLAFMEEWLDAHNDSSARANGNEKVRSEVTRKWQQKYSTITVARTVTGVIAGGGNKSDRSPDLNHTMDTLDLEIGMGILSRSQDVDIYNIHSGHLRRAKEIVQKREVPFAVISTTLRGLAGILDYSRAMVIYAIKTAPDSALINQINFQSWAAKTFTETDHANPDPYMIAVACGQLPKIEETASDVSSPEQMSAADAVANAESQPGGTEAPVTDPSATSPELGNAKPGKVSETAGLAGTTEAPKLIENSDTVDVENPGRGCFSVAAIFENSPLNINLVSEGIPAEHASNEVEKEEAPHHHPLEVFPTYFEPGRYEGIPNEVYHAAEGVSSSMVKDARISLMYFYGRHVTGDIRRETSDALTFGTLVHIMALEPETLEQEFAIPSALPAGAISTSGEMKKIIETYNASLPALRGTEEIKAILETYNASLPTPISLSGDVSETARLYTALPQEFRRIGESEKHTAAAMKSCIKEFNATLPAMLKTGGNRDAILSELAKIAPDVASEEREKAQPFNTSGLKDELAVIVRNILPDVVFADQHYEEWAAKNAGKTLISEEQYNTAGAIRAALMAHPSASKLLAHPSRITETSYFGMDEETGLEVRVRPDIELDLDGLRIAADLKTTSMGRIKQDFLRSRLHREITERDYHLSAAMYSEVAQFDQFFWIFVNKDPGYHWVAVIEASPDLLELGSLEYHRTMNSIAIAYDTGIWPAPITEDYTDQLNDFDLKRLDTLRPV